MDVFETLPQINSIFEFIIGIVTVGGFVYGLWKVLVLPVKAIYNKIEELESAMKCVNTEILPVIRSLDLEFTKNSGKSIMDRILRIDDNTRLAELRSKLIASALVSASMCEFDKHGSLNWANKAFLCLVGMDSEQIKGNGWFVAIDENVRAKVWSLWRHSIESGIPFESEFIVKNQITHSESLVKCLVYPHKSTENMQGPALGYYGSISVSTS